MTKTERVLPDGDYVLYEGGAWFTVRTLSVRIRSDEHGITIKVYPLNREMNCEIAECRAFFCDAEAMEESEDGDNNQANT